MLRTSTDGVETSKWGGKDSIFSTRFSLPSPPHQFLEQCSSGHVASLLWGGGGDFLTSERTTLHSVTIY